jgi:gamma-glutamyltranspeptidase
MLFGGRRAIMFDANIGLAIPATIGAIASLVLAYGTMRSKIIIADAIADALRGRELKKRIGRPR